jgi:hypothetical protein
VRYKDGSINFDDAREVMNLGWAQLESLFSTGVPYRAVFPGVVTEAALSVALLDETFDPDALDAAGVDRTEDLYDWDAALFAGLAASDETAPNEPGARPSGAPSGPGTFNRPSPKPS